jgi:hypothetical protein
MKLFSGFFNIRGIVLGLALVAILFATTSAFAEEESTQRSIGDTIKELYS